AVGVREPGEPGRDAAPAIGEGEHGAGVAALDGADAGDGVGAGGGAADAVDRLGRVDEDAAGAYDHGGARDLGRGHRRSWRSQSGMLTSPVTFEWTSSKSPKPVRSAKTKTERPEPGMLSYSQISCGMVSLW